MDDYYLFDHTGFIIVRPASRTFSSYAFSDVSHTINPTDDAPFARFDRVATDDVDLTRHAPVDVYWHANSASGQIIQGHLAIHDTQLSELSVLAMFGATRGLADVVSSQGEVPSEIVTVTAAAHFYLPGEDHARRNVITRHMVWGLEVAEVDLSRLVLPDGFAETEWPGFEGSEDLPQLSADGGAKWRRLPGVQR